MKYTILTALLLVLSLTAAAQQKENPLSDKEKAEQRRAENFKKFAAPMMAETEQRKAIIRDLLDTCAKCRAYDVAYYDAIEGSEQQRLRDISASNCHEILDAKLARTSLDVLAPYQVVIKGVDPQMAKRIAIWILYDAYEYGAERAKNSIDKP